LPTGIEELVAGIAAAAMALIEAGAALAPFQSQPASAGYADFGAQQCRNPPSDAELQDGSYASPGANVAYDGGQDSVRSLVIDFEPVMVVGNQPSSAPKPASSGQPAAARLNKIAAPTAPDAPDEPPAPDPPEPPLFEIDTRYVRITLDFNPWKYLMFDTNVEPKTNQIIRDVLDINPSHATPSLPGDEIRAAIKDEDNGLGTKALRTVADVIGAGGVSDTLDEVIMTWPRTKAGSLKMRRWNTSAVWWSRLPV
jgi:hypothetical protein